MKMDKIFGYYSETEGWAQIYDGSKRTPTNTVVNGRVGFSIPKIFDGECTRETFDRIIKEQSL
jgi:hypothetical protein